jgi:hypothetical protein
MAIGNLDNLPGTTRIAFLTPNLKKAGSASHNKYEANIGATTLTQLRARPGASDDKDINWGAARHFITVQGLLPPPLIVDRHAKCHLCNSVYTTGARRPEPAWAWGHRACHYCQGRHHTACFYRFERETCSLCYRPVGRLNTWQ